MKSPLRTLTAYLILAVKGAAYGITHIVPGIGGGLILVVMGIYPQFVDAVGNFFTRRDRWREYIPFLLTLGAGMVVSLLAIARVLTALADRYPVALAFFFMGLLVGTIPSVLRLHQDMRVTPGRVVALIGGLLFVIAFRLVQQRMQSGGAGNLEGPGGAIYNLLVSFVAGGASVTPGLDGTYIWILAGAYQRILGAVSNLTDLSIEWNILIPAGIGAVVGILAFSKAIDTVFKRWPSLAYYAVLGLIVGSVYGLWPTVPRTESLLVVAAGFVGGAAAAMLLGRSEGEATPSARAVVEGDAPAPPAV